MRDPDWATGLTCDDLDAFTDWLVEQWYLDLDCPDASDVRPLDRETDAGPAGST